MIERYVTGGLPEGEQDRLEEHLLACESCRDELEDLALLRERFKDERWAVEEDRAPSLSTWLWAMGTAAAVVVLAVFFWPRLVSQSPGLDTELGRLAQVEAPPYEPRSLRALDGEAEEIFEGAMVAYQEADYAGAVPGLEAAVASDPTLVKAHFYLGASLLLTDRPREAIESLGRVIGLTNSEYEEWAHFYRAKGYLQLGQIDASRADLEEVVGLEGDLRPQAEEVLEQLQNRVE